MSHVDFDLLRQRIRDSSRRTFDAVRAAHPAEKFYVFALYSYEDAVGVSPSANTEEAYQIAVAKKTSDEEYQKWLGSHGISFSASLLGDQRWSPYEWKYECAESDSFKSVDALINHRGMGFYDRDDPMGFVTFKANVLASMVLALGDLNSDGYFGEGSERNAMTIFCSIPNSSLTAWLEEDSARRLNPPAVFQKFAEERIKWIANGAEIKHSEPDSVEEVYLSLVRNR